MTSDGGRLSFPAMVSLAGAAAPSVPPQPLRGTGSGVLSRRATCPHEAASCRALWRAVILQALADADGQAEVRDHHGKPVPRERARARDWFGTGAFRVVCHLAGLDPEGVLRARVHGWHRAAMDRSARASASQRKRRMAP